MIITKARSTAKSVLSKHKHDDEPIIIEQDGIKVIEGEFHTLFVSKEDRKLEEFQTEHNGEVLTAVKEMLPEHDKYTLYIESFGHSKNQLHKIMNELRQAKEYDVLELRIDSPGGYVSEGISLYNTMREVFSGRTTTFLDSTGYSMGAVIFSLGDERIAYEESSLMYHNYSTGYYGKGDEIKSYIDFEDRHFTQFFTDKIVKKGFLTAEEYREMSIGKDFWFDAVELAQRGIATHVVVDGYKLDAEAFLEYKKQDMSISEWAIVKVTEMAEEMKKKATEDQKKADADAKRMAKIMDKAQELIEIEEEEAEKKKAEKKADKKAEKKPTISKDKQTDE